MNRNGNSNQLKIGDWVKLRAGSQQMQILEIEDGGAKCLWFLGLDQQLAWVSFAVLVNADRGPRHGFVPSLEASM